MPQKWTIKPRRGILHLVKFLIEDTDRGLMDPQHAMYRQLTAPERRELEALMTWLCEQHARDQEAPKDIEQAARESIEAAQAPKPPAGPTLFDAGEPTSPTQPDQAAHVAPVLSGPLHGDAG